MEDKEIIKHLSNEYPEFYVVGDIVEIRNKETFDDEDTITFADIYLYNVLRGVVAISGEGQIKYQKITNLIEEIQTVNNLWNKEENQEEEKKTKNQSLKKTNKK